MLMHVRICMRVYMCVCVCVCVCVQKERAERARGIECTVIMTCIHAEQVIFDTNGNVK